MSYINQVRSFSRSYTQTLGLLNQHILSSPFSLIESRIIYELFSNGSTTARELCASLKTDKGYMSRILKRLEKSGFISTRPSDSDKRVKNLVLTRRGEEVFRVLDRASQDQVAQLLSPLSIYEKQRLVSSLSQAEQLIDGRRTSLDDIVVRHELRPGDIGFIIQSHGELYQQECGYTTLFEQYVMEGLLESLSLAKPNRSKIWICEHKNNKVGCIFIVDRGDEAQLRFFFIFPEYRGIGLGAKLMSLSMAHLRDEKFHSCYLWTTEEQKAAQALYGRYGFELVEEKTSSDFGKTLVEQKYRLLL